MNRRDEHGGGDLREIGVLDARGASVPPRGEPVRFASDPRRPSGSGSAELRTWEYTLVVGDERVPARIDAGETRELELRVGP